MSLWLDVLQELRPVVALESLASCSTMILLVVPLESLELQLIVPQELWLVVPYRRLNW